MGRIETLEQKINMKGELSYLTVFLERYLLRTFLLILMVTIP